MRVDLKKVLLFGPMRMRDPFLAHLQGLGIAELISDTSPSLEMPSEVQVFIQALHVLRRMVPVKQAPGPDARAAHVLAQHIVERNALVEQLREKIRLLRQESVRVAPFGDFSPEERVALERESGRVFQFFFCKEGKEPVATERPEVISIRVAHGLHYFLSIQPERTQYEGLIEMVIDRPLGVLQQDIAESERQLDVYETELATLAHYKDTVRQGLVDALNAYHLQQSKEQVHSLMTGEAFACEAWVPVNQIERLSREANAFHIFIENIQIEETDRLPTHLDNEGIGRMGEDLVGIYDTPSPADRDPSRWVFFSFAIFFSMIVADAGYGLVLLALSLWLLWKWGKKGGLVRRVIILSNYLAIGCIAWGIVTTSFFGIEFAPHSPLKKVSLIHWMVEKKAAYLIEKKPSTYQELVQEYPQLEKVQTPEALLQGVVRQEEGEPRYVLYENFTGNVLIEIALFLGTVHVLLSFLRYLDKNWAGIGWICFLVGGYLFFPSVLNAVSLIHYVFHIPQVEGAWIGKYLLYSGIGIAFVLALIQKRLLGLAEPMQVISVFADVMSYLRIYALSLAGMVMGATFVRIGLSAPWFVAPFIFLAGHLVNLTLSLMGGLIHGLRLNFIEWYHYSFEGGGRKFRPLSRIKLDPQ